MKNYQYFETNIFHVNSVFYGVFRQKNGKGWSHNIETYNKEKSGVLENIISETIHAQENGSRGTHFAIFLISKGLNFSAMVTT